MKKFGKYIIGGALAILITMLVLDFLYTKIYETSFPRTKFQYLRSFKNKNIDYIFIGSSRVESGIIPSIIKEKTGKTALNLGFQAARLSDIYTIVQLISEFKIKCQRIFIQVDYIYNMNGHSSIFKTQLMPFVRETKILKMYNERYSENTILNYYIPFYRYCDNDLKIGFREIFASLVHKETNIIENNGYVGLYGNSTMMGGSLPNTILKSNSILDSIKVFVRRNNMDVVFYCAPFCKDMQNQHYLLKLKSKIPGLLDFSKVIKEDTQFMNCNHLNDSGAKQFTENFIQQVLIRNEK